MTADSDRFSKGAAVKKTTYSARPLLTTMWRAFLVLTFIVFLGARANSVSAQSLNWEGQTGIFVTPLAYTLPSENGLANPLFPRHYLGAGDVLGGFHEVSVTEGAFRRVEFGCTQHSSPRR